jgi:hypothetical protein
MSLSPQDASAALDDIARAETRSATLRDYQHAAPHLILWGVLWAVGYGLNDFFPVHANTIWSVIVPIGVLADLAALRGGRTGAWRYIAAMAAAFAFLLALFFVMAPVSGRQVAAVIPLCVALMYVLRGIRAGPRHVVAGVMIAALTLGGFWWLTSHFLLWMAAVGGGALILAGLWLRRV